MLQNYEKILNFFFCLFVWSASSSVFTHVLHPRAVFIAFHMHFSLIFFLFINMCALFYDYGAANALWLWESSAINDAVNDTGKCHVLLLNDVLIECLTASSSYFDERNVIRRKVHKENPSRHFMISSSSVRCFSCGCQVMTVATACLLIYYDFNYGIWTTSLVLMMRKKLFYGEIKNLRVMQQHWWP